MNNIISAKEFREGIKSGKYSIEKGNVTTFKDYNPEVTKKSKHNKYGAVKTLYKGVTYDSKKEADEAKWIDSEIRYGRIASVERQIRIRCEINDTKICDYIIDFIITYPDGVKEYIDVKGMRTPVFNLKKKLVEALHPNIKIILK